MPNKHLNLWHEGQMRARAGQNAQAATLFKQSHESGEPDAWRLYVDATVGFMENDWQKMVQARDTLAKVAFPPDAPEALKGHWPPNLAIVNHMLDCKGLPYRLAYDPTKSCTKPKVD